MPTFGDLARSRRTHWLRAAAVDDRPRVVKTCSAVQLLLLPFHADDVSSKSQEHFNAKSGSHERRYPFRAVARRAPAWRRLLLRRRLCALGSRGAARPRDRTRDPPGRRAHDRVSRRDAGPLLRRTGRRDGDRAGGRRHHPVSARRRPRHFERSGDARVDRRPVVLLFPAALAASVRAHPAWRQSRDGRARGHDGDARAHDAQHATTARLDGGSSERATIVCGFLGCDARPFNPLLAALPPLLHIPGAVDKSEWIAHFIRVAVDESNTKRPGGEAVLERLSEVMFVDVVRHYLQELPPMQTGWLAGLRDRHVGRALGLLHERPSHRWTIDALGDAVGLSRSALHERFAELVGQPPMQYLAQWRMQVASRLLLESTMNVASIALETGYDSEAAFSRAFKRLVGVPPATWRRQRMMHPTSAPKVLSCDAAPVSR